MEPVEEQQPPLPFLIEPSGALQTQLRALAETASEAFSSRDMATAFGLYRAHYELLLTRQPTGHRFHKGWALYNMGIAAHLDDAIEVDSSNLFLLAFVEDCLTYAETHNDHPTDSPAAKVLVYVLSMAGTRLVALLAEVEERVGKGMLYADPESLVRTLVEEGIFQQPVIYEERIDLKRIPGKFSSDWNHRIFVGGSYRGQIAEINEISRLCRDGGFDPVVELEFEIPQDQIHHHALMLLHECRWAIFEVTTAAGQLMELERARDYGIRPLVLYQGVAAYAQVSEMVNSLLSRLDLEAHSYSTMEELEHHVLRYLEEISSDVQVRAGP